MDLTEQENALELKRKLRRRLGLAAVLILALLGVLAAFDHLSKLEDEETTIPVAPVQPRLGPSISSARPETPAMPAEAPLTPSPTLAPKDQTVTDQAPPKPEVSARPAIAPLPVVPSPTALPTAPPATATPKPPAPIAPLAAAPIAAVAPMPVPARPAPLAKPQPPAPIPAAAAVPEDSASAPLAGLPATRLAAPATPASTAGSAPPRPVLSRLAAGFVLQAGVFTSTERAEELKAKLLTAGVPVTIESRVQVGPFASQQEADAARRKIRELGVDSILIPPRAGRR